MWISGMELHHFPTADVELEGMAIYAHKTVHGWNAVVADRSLLDLLGHRFFPTIEALEEAVVLIATLDVFPERKPFVRGMVERLAKWR